MRTNVRIIVPLSKELFGDDGKPYTGAQHFSSLFLKYFDMTQHTIIGLGLESPPGDVGITCRTVDRGANPWLWASLYLPTQDILAIADGRETAEATQIIHTLSREFLALKPDVFFLNGLSAITYLFALAAHRAGIPIVTTYHGIWAIEAGAHPALAKSKDAVRLRAAIERQIASWSTETIFLTDLSYRIFRKNIGRVPTAKRKIIPIPYNPVFSEKNPTTPITRARTTKKIGLVGRWDPIKNHEAYLALAKEAAQQKLPWEFVAATTPNEAVTALKELVTEYKKNIVLTSHLAPIQLKDFYRDLDAVIVPSHFETFCGVVMEALLQEIPVLVSPRVGMSDILKKFGLKRWIMPFKSPRKVIRRLKKALAVPVPPEIRMYLLRENEAENIFKQYEEIFIKVAK